MHSSPRQFMSLYKKIKRKYDVTETNHHNPKEKEDPKKTKKVKKTTKK